MTESFIIKFPATFNALSLVDKVVDLFNVDLNQGQTPFNGSRLSIINNSGSCELDLTNIISGIYDFSFETITGGTDGTGLTKLNKLRYVHSNVYTNNDILITQDPLVSIKSFYVVDSSNLDRINHMISVENYIVQIESEDHIILPIDPNTSVGVKVNKYQNYLEVINALTNNISSYYVKILYRE